MEKSDNAETSTSDKAARINRFSGTDFCTFGNALREAATEIKGRCLGFKYVKDSDLETFLINTSEFLDAAVVAWEAIRHAIKDDDGTLSVHGIMDKHRI